jgi:hypothetical protein
MRCFLLSLLTVLLVGSAHGVPGSAQEPASGAPTAEQVLARLRGEHPRLLLDDAGVEELKTRIERDSVLKGWEQKLRREAEELLSSKPSEYRIPDGKRLLATSRAVLGRTYTLALMYRLHGEERYRDRLWRELEAAAAFKDWNPSHFLDTAEMTHAFAIGYDWLYDAWSDDQRRVIREALVKHGLTPGVKCYRGEARYGGWRNSDHNWNQVCNGGLTMGALALAEEEPELAGEILAAAIKSVPKAMASYAPDGAWGEGPGYWHYATTYNVVMIAGLESALGTDFGLSQAEGFDRTGAFPIHLVSPAGLSYNFADAGRPSTIRAPELFWLSQKFDQPLYAAYQRRHADPHPLDLVWYPPDGAPATAPDVPRDAYYREAEVVTMRSSWDDPDAVFVAFKAGDNKVNHSHLDLGSLVLDSLGERWAADLGSDDYNLPDYFGSKRWTYYRLRAEGHNTLVLNPGKGPDQDPKAATRVTRFESTPQQVFAVSDLTPAYAEHAERVHRGVRFLDRRAVLIQDEVECKQPSQLWWFLHTPAKATLSDDGRTAMLEQRGKRLLVRLAAPTDARFEVLAAEPLPSSPDPAGQKENGDVKKLSIHLTDVRDTRIAVFCEPAMPGAEEGLLPELEPLEAWGGRSP